MSFNHEGWFADNDDETSEQGRDQEHGIGESANWQGAQPERAQATQNVQQPAEKETLNTSDMEPAAPRNAGASPAAERDNPWVNGGALLAALSVAASALLADDSKTVRSKALVCCIRILKTHAGCLGEDGHALCHPDSIMEDVRPVLLAVSRVCHTGGRWCTLHYLAHLLSVW